MSLNDNIYISSSHTSDFFLIPFYSRNFLLLLFVYGRSQFHYVLLVYHRILSLRIIWVMKMHFDEVKSYYDELRMCHEKRTKRKSNWMCIHEFDRTKCIVWVMIFLGMVSKKAKYLAKAIRALFNSSMWMKRHSAKQKQVWQSHTNTCSHLALDLSVVRCEHK